MPIPLRKRQSLSFKPLISKHVPTRRVTEPLINKKEMSFPPKVPFINNLPVELQVEIFFQCLSPFPTFSIDEAPLSIARVCRAWNHLVFNSPKLWSAFEIQIEGRTTSISPGRVESIHSKVKQWLLRSKQCPLSIKVSGNLMSRFGDSRFKQLVSLLEAEAHRWKHVEFTVPATAIHHILTNNLPALQSLVLRLTGHSTSLSLDRVLHHTPWRQIIYLDLQPEDPSLINLDGCLDILSHTERLKECTLKVDCAMDLHDIHHQHHTGVLLPLLNKLTLNLHHGIRTRTGSPEGCLAQFLNTISVPRLETLHLGWYGPNQTTDSWTAHHTQFLEFFTSITKTMRSLSIAYIPFSEEELRQCLSCLQNLTHLALKYPLSDAYDDPVTSSFLSSLTFPPILDGKDDVRPTKPHLLLPLLEHCEIEGHGRGYTSAGIVEFIESRSSGALRQDIQLGMIKSCRIFSTNIISDEMEDYVTKWKKSGMEMSIGSLVIR